MEGNLSGAQLSFCINSRRAEYTWKKRDTRHDIVSQNLELQAISLRGRIRELMDGKFEFAL